LRIFSSSWFRMTSASCMHNFVTVIHVWQVESHVHVANVRLGKLPVLRSTLFCRRCNFVRFVSARNFPGGTSISHHRYNVSFVEGQFNDKSLIAQFG
jgi:hypothetical protein